jgi:hypothetical protein
MSDKLFIAKAAINVIAGAGVSKVVNDIIQMNTVTETNTDKAKVWIGSAIIGSMAADRSSEYVGDKIDKAVAWWTARKAVKTTAEVVS